MYTSLHKGQYLACISMGIGKAFHSLPHCLTFRKYYAYKHTYILLASYFHNCK